MIIPHQRKQQSADTMDNVLEKVLAEIPLRVIPVIHQENVYEVTMKPNGTSPEARRIVELIGDQVIGDEIDATTDHAWSVVLGYFAQALGLRRLPSEETLRQRMDQLGTAPLAVLHEESAGMIRRHAPPLLPCHERYIPLDVDVSPLDNSGTKKEGVACTYKKHDGYAPAFAYLGQEGYLLHCELRPGDQHCQKGTPEFLERAILQV